MFFPAGFFAEFCFCLGFCDVGDFCASFAIGFAFVFGDEGVELGEEFGWFRWGDGEGFCLAFGDLEGELCLCALLGHLDLDGDFWC